MFCGTFSSTKSILGVVITSSRKRRGEIPNAFAGLVAVLILFGWAGLWLFLSARLGEPAGILTSAAILAAAMGILALLTKSLRSKHLALAERNEERRVRRKAAGLTLEELQKMDSDEFERLVKQLFRTSGYKIRPHKPGPGDHGVDIDLDAPNGDHVVIQCKRYATTHKVGEPDLQRFGGSVGHFHAKRGIFVTSSYFTSSAKQFAKENVLELVDGPQLLELLRRADMTRDEKRA